MCGESEMRSLRQWKYTGKEDFVNLVIFCELTVLPISEPFFDQLSVKDRMRDHTSPMEPF